MHHHIKNNFFEKMNRFIWMIITVGMLHACNPKEGYLIRGELADANGWKVVLAKVSADSEEPVKIDSCVIKKGKFRMKGTVDYPEYCVLYVGDNGPLPLIVENTEMDIAVNLQNIQESKVTGSKETDLLMELFHWIHVFDDRRTKVNNDYMLLKRSGETDIEKEKEYFALMDTIQQQAAEYAKLFITEYPNHIVTALIMQSNLPNIAPEELEQYVNGFDEVNSQSPWVQSIKEEAASIKRLAIGQPFTDLKMPSPKGNEVALSDYAGKDKYVLIDFWASWCGPCRRANPHVVDLYKKYKDKGFEIVGVSFDKDKTEWLNAIEADALTWIQMSDLKYWQSEGAKLYSVNSIPYTVLLDKDGNILAKGLQPDEIEKKLAELMENN